MQIEILEFLLDAQRHFRSDPVERDTADRGDLQAVDRALPDCDWFELAEFRCDHAPAELRWEIDAVDFGH